MFAPRVQLDVPVVVEPIEQTVLHCLRSSFGLRGLGPIPKCPTLPQLLVNNPGQVRPVSGVIRDAFTLVRPSRPRSGSEDLHLEGLQWLVCNTRVRPSPVPPRTIGVPRQPCASSSRALASSGPRSRCVTDRF